MNLNEAAEIVKFFPPVRSRGLSVEQCEALTLVANTMLTELDPTPITEEWLLAEGFTRNKHPIGRDDFTNNYFWLSRCDGSWLFDVLDKRVELTAYYIATIGQLRTLVRVFGGGDDH